MKRFGIRSMTEHQLAAGIIVFLFLLTAFAPITSAFPAEPAIGKSSDSSGNNTTAGWNATEIIGGAMGKHHRPLPARILLPTVNQSPDDRLKPVESKASALTVASGERAAKPHVDLWDILHMIIVPVTFTFELAAKCAPPALEWIVDHVSTDSPALRASTMDVHTWDGGGANVYAGTKENWDTNIHPVAGDTVVFNSGALPCTWNLTDALDRFYMNATYTGTITQAASFSVTSYSQAAGIFTGSTSYTLTDSGNFIISGTGSINNQFKLSITGTGVTVSSTSSTIQSLSCSGSALIASAFSSYFLTNTGTITINAPNTLNVFIYSGEYSNTGTITGTGSLIIQIRTGTSITLGSISCPLQLRLNSGAATSASFTIAATTNLGSTLLVDSLHATYTATLNLNGYSLSAAGITIGARGIITQGTGTITCTSYTQNGASSVFTQGGAVSVTGTTALTVGALSASTGYTWTQNGAFTHTTGFTLADNTLNLVMSGNGYTVTMATANGFRTLTINDNTIVNRAAGNFYTYGLTVALGKILTITASQTLVVFAAYSNSGTITGSSGTMLDFLSYSQNLALGTVTTQTVQFDNGPAASANMIIMLTAVFSTTGALIVKSSHATYTTRLDLSTTNYALTVAGITIDTRGIVNGRASIITDSSNWDSSAGTFNKNTSSVIMTGLTKTVKTAITNGGFYNLQISNTISTISSVNVSHSLTVDSGKTFTIGALLYVDFNCSGGGSFSNPGLIAGTGTMYFSFNTASMNLAFGVINTPVIARTAANALANYTLKLTHGVTFNGTFTARSDPADYYYHVLTIDTAGYTMIFKAASTFTYGSVIWMRTATIDLYGNFDVSHGNMLANTSTVRVMVAGLSIWSKGSGAAAYHNLSFMPAAGVTTMENTLLQAADGILYGGGGQVYLKSFFYRYMNRWSVINGTMAGTGVFNHGAGGCVAFYVSDWNTQIYAGGWTWIGVADIDINSATNGNLRAFIQSNLACGASLSPFTPTGAGSTLNIYLGNWTYTMARDIYIHGGGAGVVNVYGQNSLIIAGRYFWSWDVGVNWYANTSTVRLTGTGGAVDIRMRAGQSFYNLQLQASTVTTSATTLRVEHNFTLNAGRTLTVGAGLTFTYNGSGGGIWSNAGTVTGGTMYFDYNTADSTITFGDMNSPTQIRTVATATGNRICTLGAATTFDSSLTVVSTHAIWMITLDAGADRLLGVWGTTTLGAEGAMVQRAGAWTFWGAFTENSATAVFEAGATINYLSAVTISAGTFNANSGILLIGHNWDSSTGQFNGMNSVANMSMLGAVAHTAYAYPFNTLNILIGGSVQANPVLHAKNLTIQSGASLTVLVNGTTVFTFLDLNGTISSAGWFINITASNTNVAWLNGSWDGNIALNGTASYYSLYTRCPMTGSLYTNSTLYINVNSTSGNIRVTPTNAWTNITLLYINTTFAGIGALVAEWWASSNTTPALVEWGPTLLPLAGYSARFDGVLIALAQSTGLGKFPFSYNGAWSTHLITIWQMSAQVGGGPGAGAPAKIICDFGWKVNFALVSFTDKTLGNIVEWHWSFGDGAYNESQDPRHKYTAVGTYTVTLTAMDSAGRVGTRTYVVHINELMSSDTIFEHIPVWLLLPIFALAIFALIGTQNRYVRFGCIVTVLALAACMLIGGKLG